MVEGRGGSGDPAPVPTIAALLTQYRDRTGASYDDMSKMIGGSLSVGRLQQLATKPPDSFPRKPETVRRLAELLHVSITTVLEAFAASLGLDVEQHRSMLSISLPPGTDSLTDRDRTAILMVIRQLIDARRPTPAGPDLSRAEGLRLAPDEGTNHDTRTGR